jgi:serine/threonine-protein kinase
MGVVLAAHHELLDRRVAVKVLTVRDRKGVSRFLREARSAACLNSPHVARVMDVGALRSGAPFIVMEYLEGCDLEQLLKSRRRLPMEEAVGYVLQACEGLAQAHAVGIVHRDLKPANLFLTVQPNGTRLIKILDFGISKPASSQDNGKIGTLTEEHATLGSPAYMAPEQIRAAKDVDRRSDLWSLGVVLFELLTGHAPFTRKSLGELFAAILEKDAPPLTSVLPNAPAALSDAVVRCIHREPEQRFQDVLQFAKEIAPFGPGDAAGRVALIEETLRHIKPNESPAVAPGDPVGSPPAPDSPRDALLRRATQVTAHVAFTSDTPRPIGRKDVVTVPSAARTARRRVLGSLAAAFCVAGIVLTAAVLRTRAGGSPPLLTAPAAAPVGGGSVVVAEAPAASVIADPPPPVVPVTSLPLALPVPTNTVAPRQYPPARPRPAPSPPKKHLGVLDSPD